MSVLGPLLDFSRAIIHAHNNAKVRNLMDLPRAQTEEAAFRHERRGALPAAPRSAVEVTASTSLPGKVLEAQIESHQIFA
jgi:hypothetical protein